MSKTPKLFAYSVFGVTHNADDSITITSATGFTFVADKKKAGVEARARFRKAHVGIRIDQVNLIEIPTVEIPGALIPTNMQQPVALIGWPVAGVAVPWKEAA